MKDTISYRRSIPSRILGFAAGALLAAGLPLHATPEVSNSGPNTWVGGGDLPIWSLVGNQNSENWSFHTNPGPTDNVLFPTNVPTFPNATSFGAIFSTVTDGHTILLNGSGVVLDPNSLTFDNNYTLVDLSVFDPGFDSRPTENPGHSAIGFFGGPVKAILGVGSGGISVGGGFTVTIDVDIQAMDGTLNKLGDGALLLNDTVNGNVVVQQGLLGGNFTVNGNLTNYATLSPGNSPGTIYVQGNFQQAKGANLVIQVASGSSYDHLNVGGTASLGGGLTVSLLNGFTPKKGEKFTFLTAGSLSGTFDDVNSPTWGFLTLRPFYNNDSVFLRAVVSSFEGLPGLTPNQQAVAHNLDLLIDDPHATKLLNYLYNQNLSQLPGDFDKIAPEELTSIFALGTALSQVQAGNIQNRTGDIRNGSNGSGGPNGSSGFSAAGLALNGAGPSYSGAFGITTGVAGPNGRTDDGKESKEVKNVAPVEQRWGAFLSGTGEWVNVSGTDNARGYNLTSGGFTLGVDYKVCPNFAIGLMAGYTGTSADLTDHGRVYVNGGKIGLYGTTFVGGWYADIAATGGYNSYDTRRAGLQGEARGNTDGGEFDALFGTGYDFKFGGFTAGPTASFNYTNVATNGFTESGSLVPLNVHGGESESLRSAFGFKASYDLKCGGMVIKPEVRAAWQHEYGDTAYALDSSFANGGGQSFQVNGPKLGRDSVLVGAGFAIQVTDRVSTYFYYDGELGRTNYESNSVSGGVRVTF